MKRGSIPKHPFRDTAIFYGGLTIALIVIGALVGAPLLPRSSIDHVDDLGIIPLAVFLFVVSTSYAWWRFQRRIDREGQP
jgi:hypothetical protein